MRMFLIATAVIAAVGVYVQIATAASEWELRQAEREADKAMREMDKMMPVLEDHNRWAICVAREMAKENPNWVLVCG